LVGLHGVGVGIQRARWKLKEIFQSAECLKIDLNNTAMVKSQFEGRANLFLCIKSMDCDVFGFTKKYRRWSNI
jgi:hypothetical protein